MDINLKNAMRILGENNISEAKNIPEENLKLTIDIITKAVKDGNVKNTSYGITFEDKNSELGKSLGAVVLDKDGTWGISSSKAI